MFFLLIYSTAQQNGKVKSYLKVSVKAESLSLSLILLNFWCVYQLDISAICLA